MTVKVKTDNTFRTAVVKDWKRNRVLYMLLTPAIIYYIMFQYMPILGNIIAFKDFSPRLGILGSNWIGFMNFTEFFKDPSFIVILKNTFTISVTSIVFGFPSPIILALLINELKSKYFTRTVQTISYLPHFISIVVVAGLVKNFLSTDGLITDLLVGFGVPSTNLLGEPQLFVPIYVLSGIWQEVGWGSIIYLAALMSIDTELYEAARIDGAGRWKQTLHITLPCLYPTIIVMLILRLGNIMSVGFEKVLLLYNPLTYSTADVISTFTYRVGMINRDFGFASAVDIFNSIINCMLLLSANYMSKKMVDSSIY